MKDLIKVAKKLDSLGLTKEASALGAIIRKIAADRVKDLMEFDDGNVINEMEQYTRDFGPGFGKNRIFKGERPPYAPYSNRAPEDYEFGEVTGYSDSDGDLVPADTTKPLTSPVDPSISPSMKSLMERLWNGATRAIGKDEIVSAMALEKKGLVMITDPGVQKWPKMWLGLELTELGKKLIAPKEPGRRPTGGPRSHTMHSGLAEKE